MGAVSRGFGRLQGMANHNLGGGQGMHNEKACLGLWWHLPCCLPALLAWAQPFPLRAAFFKCPRIGPRDRICSLQVFSLLIPVR